MKMVVPFGPGVTLLIVAATAPLRSPSTTPSVGELSTTPRLVMTVPLMGWQGGAAFANPTPPRSRLAAASNMYLVTVVCIGSPPLSTPLVAIPYTGCGCGFALIG